jgi:hypothetical protein
VGEERLSQPAAKNPHSAELPAAESAQAELLITAETSHSSANQTAENVQPRQTFLPPRSSDVSSFSSPGLNVSLRGLSARTSTTAGVTTSPSVTNLATPSEPNMLPSGKPSMAFMTSGHSEKGISAISHHPAVPGPKTAPTSANKHELRVVPDEHSIVDDALLKCTPYIVNTKYMVLICTDCRYCIIPDRARAHLHKDHPHCRVDATFFEQLNKRFPGLVAETIHPPETTEAVFGLAIPVEKYTVCSRCRRGYLNISTWERHLCRNADANLVGQHAHFRSLVQTFFRGPSICYFPIDLPAPASGGAGDRDDFNLFKADFQEVAVSDDEIHESEDYRELNQFLLKEGWINHVSGLRSSELSLLTCLPKDDEILKPIAREVFALTDSIQRAIGAAGYHVRRLLGRRPAYVFPFTILYHR